MGRSLNAALGMTVEYFVLDHFYRDVPGVLQEYDLVITTYHHLAEINQAIKSHAGVKGKLVGIDTRPTPETMLRIARLPSPRIGVVCTNRNTAHMLKHILYGYHPEWEIEAVSLEDDQDEIRQLAQSSDHFVVTHTCADEVTRISGRTPDVIVQFQIDEQSVLYLRQRIYEIQTAKMKLLHASLSPGENETG
jgi:GntR family transcriptional regulator